MRRLLILALATSAAGAANAQADNNGQVDPLTDGLLILRNSEAKPCGPATIKQGGNTKYDPLTDGLLVIRHNSDDPLEPGRQAGRIDMKADGQPQGGPAVGGELKLGQPPPKRACR